MERREFLQHSGVAAAAGAAAAGTMPAKVLGANDRLRVGFVGCGRVSDRHVREIMANPNVEIVAMCDCYDANLERRVESAKKTGCNNVKKFGDYRKMLDTMDLNILINSTPDHWHALPSIEACNMGIDVYVEKPISHNIYESQKMVEAARKNKCVVQVGTQQRSGIHFQKAMKLVREGYLGKVSQVRCMNTRNDYPNGIGNPADTPPPAGLDWDMWLGPAPYKSHNKNYWDNEGDWGRFRWFWDYAGGYVTDWFTHWLDIVQPAMGVKFPKSVVALGDRYHIRDNADTPDTLQAVLEYDDFICTYNTTSVTSRQGDNVKGGITFFGTDATMRLSRGGWEIFPEYDGKGDDRKARVPAEKHPTSDQNMPHFKNFVDCVRNRKRPVSDIEDGYWTSVGVHLTNIAARTKSCVEWDARSERIVNNPAAEKLFKRDYRAPWKLPA